MTIDVFPAGQTVFIDANILTYHFQPHPVWGQSCTNLLRRIENQECSGVTSVHVLAELSHRLMTLEAHTTLGWPVAGIANRLRTNPAQVQKLSVFKTAIEKTVSGRLQVLPLVSAMLGDAVLLAQQFGLLTNDAIIVAIMRTHGVTNIASGDRDFDQIPGITRYALG